MTTVDMIGFLHDPPLGHQDDDRKLCAIRAVRLNYELSYLMLLDSFIPRYLKILMHPGYYLFGSRSSILDCDSRSPGPAAPGQST